MASWRWRILLPGGQQQLSGDLSATVTDLEGLLDSIVTVADYLRSRDDVLGLSDSVTYDLIQGVTITDPLGLVDDGEWFKTAPDLLGILDDVTYLHVVAGTVNVTVTDSLGLVDSVTTVADYSPTITDPLGLLDDVSVSTTGATFWSLNPAAYVPVEAGDTPPAW